MKLTHTKLTSLWVAILLSFCTYFVYAEGSDLAKAIMNAQAATKASEGKAVAEHAEVALTRAKAALASTDANAAKEHLNAAIKSLNEAIEHGKQGHTDLAKKAAIEAKAHLKAAR